MAPATPNCVVAVSEPTANASAIYRRASSKDGFPTLEVTTLYELFNRSVEKYGDLPALGRRPIDQAGGPLATLGAGNVADTLVVTQAAILAPLGEAPATHAVRAAAPAAAAACTCGAHTNQHLQPPHTWVHGTQNGKAGDYVFMTYSEAGEAVGQIASALATLGLGKADRVGVYGANCCEWMIAMQVGRDELRGYPCGCSRHGAARAALSSAARTSCASGRPATPYATLRAAPTDTPCAAPPRPPRPAPPRPAPPRPASQACNRMSYECVPLYDSLGETAIEFIMRHSEMAAVFVAGPKAGKLAQALQELQVR
jgi:hypothetical protein